MFLSKHATLYLKYAKSAMDEYLIPKNIVILIKFFSDSAVLILLWKEKFLGVNFVITWKCIFPKKCVSTR